MRVQLAALDPAVRVYRPDAADVIFVDPATPEEEAVLLVALFGDVSAGVARAWLVTAYAQDPCRHIPTPRPADVPEGGEASAVA